jgi:hypothetical protein
MMKAHLSAALIGLSFATVLAGQRGVVNGLRLSAETVEPGTAVTLTASGTNPCGAVSIDYGDGKTVTHPISELPATITYVFSTPGTYRVVARGMGNCDGETSSTLRVLEPRRAPPPPAPTAPGRGGSPGDRSPSLDRNRDGVISREEWSGDDRSFRVHDWNRDGMLSGDEVREAQKDDEARREADERTGRTRRAAEAADRRFTEQDRNRDGRITRDEWNGSREELEALDRNGDWVLTRNEMSEPAAPADTPGVVTVQADRAWTDTGLDVRQGDQLSFEISGRVRLGPGEPEVTDPRGSSSGRRGVNAPVRQAFAGALIGRVGESEAFDVGVRTSPVRAPRNGRLYLGVNDDSPGDNQGAWRVRITSQNVRRRN